MPTLNTGHALYGNILACFVSNGTTVVELKTGRTCTPHANVTYGSGTYGNHFRVTRVDSYTPQGVAFTELSYNTSSSALSWFCAFNDIETTSGRLFGNPASSDNSFPNVLFDADGSAYLGYGYSGTSGGGDGTTDVVTGAVAHTIAIARPAGDGSTAKLYVDSSLEVTAGAGFGISDARADYIGGHSGQTAMIGKIFVLVIFDTLLDSTAVSGLHSSLTGSNAFSLFDSSTINSGALASTGVGAFTAVGAGSFAGVLAAAGVGTFSAASQDATSAYLSAAGVSVFTTVARSTAATAFSSAGVAAFAGTGADAGVAAVTTPPLKNNTGTVLANETGITVHIYALSGALLVTHTGVASASNGVVSVPDALMVSGTTYRVIVITASGAEAMRRIQAI